MNPDLPVYRQLAITLRPSRLAVLFYGEGDWKVSAKVILDLFSRIWGGGYNVMIPCDSAGGVKEPFLEVASRFDPDRWGVYSPSLYSRRMLDPSRFDIEMDQK